MELDGLEGMLLCGSNKEVNDISTLDRISLGLFGSNSNRLDEVEIISEYGTTRSAIPYAYLPELDYCENDAYAKFAFWFMDNKQVEVIKFKLHQLADACEWYRLAGNNVKYIIDLTNQGELFKRFKVIGRNYIRASDKEYMKTHPDARVREIYENSVRPTIYNYERLLALSSTQYKRILPLERQVTSLENALSLTSQFVKIGNIAQLRNLFSSFEEMRTPRQYLRGIQPDEI